MEELIKKLNPWWRNTFPFKSIPREKYLNNFEKQEKNKDIVLITGLRRIGKTTLMRQHIKRLIEKGTDPKKICYLSLDAYAFKNHSIQDIVREFKKIHSHRANQKLHLFLDEVAFKEDFAQELKNLYDFENAKIYATSSSASILKDRSSFLTGRSRTIEIEPLDFDEFLLFRKIDKANSEQYIIEKQFKKYMEIGGIPEYVLTQDPSYIINLVDNVIRKDVIAAHSIRRPALVKDLFILLCERVGKPLSYNRIAKILDANKETIKEYIEYFVETYLFFFIEKKAKLNARIHEEKKLYCADVGLRNITTGFRDLGAIYENLVYLKIRHNNPFFFKKEGIEIDFYYKDHLIEAKFGQELTKDQQELFDITKAKVKLIAKDHLFFDREL